MSQWIYRDQPFTSDQAAGWAAFVYLITNLDSGRRYIGKKLLTKAKRVQRKGKKRSVRVESDWPDYWGSSTELLRDVDKLGPERFSREVLHLCANKSEANFLELVEQIQAGVLLSDDFYNGYIGTRISRAGVARLRISPATLRFGQTNPT